MTTIFLTYYQRIVLWNMVGQHNAPNLKETAVFLRVLEKIRLTDQESIDTGFKGGAQAVSWQLPDPRYGEKTIELENAEAAALANAIEAAQNIKVSDAEWLVRVIEQAKQTVDAGSNGQPSASPALPVPVA